MTPSLEQAIQEVAKLSAADQDAIASIILDEIADEKRWKESFGRSQDQLGRFAAKVRSDIKANRVRDTSVEDL